MNKLIDKFNTSLNENLWLNHYFIKLSGVNIVLASFYLLIIPFTIGNCLHNLYLFLCSLFERIWKLIKNKMEVQSNLLKLKLRMCEFQYLHRSVFSFHSLNLFFCLCANSLCKLSKILICMSFHGCHSISVSDFQRSNGRIKSSA